MESPNLNFFGQIKINHDDFSPDINFGKPRQGLGGKLGMSPQLTYFSKMSEASPCLSDLTSPDVYHNYKYKDSFMKSFEQMQIIDEYSDTYDDQLFTGKMFKPLQNQKFSSIKNEKNEKIKRKLFQMQSSSQNQIHLNGLKQKNSAQVSQFSLEEFDADEKENDSSKFKIQPKDGGSPKKKFLSKQSQFQEKPTQIIEKKICVKQFDTDSLIEGQQ